jgi:hypothetical protein
LLKNNTFFALEMKYLRHQQKQEDNKAAYFLPGPFFEFELQQGSNGVLNSKRRNY